MPRAGVRLDDQGYWANWATWHGRAKQRHVTAIAEEGDATPAMFASDRVLVSRRDPEALDRLVAEGGEVLDVPALPEPPPGVRELRDVSDFPLPVVVRFAEPPRVDDPVASMERAYEARDVEHKPSLTITSEAGARLAGLVADMQTDGQQVDLDWLGVPDALALKTSTASWAAGNDPFTWPSHSGRSRIVDAWQLVEAFRAQRSLKSIVWIAILDGGFNLVNGVDPSNDLRGFGYDLASNSVKNAGGTNPNNCGSTPCPWHGTGVASAAAATVTNFAAGAGAGGTVGQMIFFKSTISVEQTLQALRVCTAWGVDVINMSFSMKRVELFFFETSDWNDAFQFAIDHGVIPVAAAGNGDSNAVGQELPDYNVRPATRTPGAITVGALDGADQAAGFSNFGSSVSIWAPGVNIPVGPDPDNPGGSTPSGTSQASPLVAGVAAMMRAVNPTIDPLTVRNIIRDTGWAGQGRVTKGLDAYAAVLAAMGNTLPPDLNESNNSAAQAQQLYPLTSGGPLTTTTSLNTIAPGDPDFYRFELPMLSTVSIAAEWYPRLGTVYLVVTAEDDRHEASVDNLGRVAHAADGTSTLTGVLPPGAYQVSVHATKVNAYTIAVTPTPMVLAADLFEPNDTFDAVARMYLKGRTSGMSYVLGWGPGRYDCTLHPDGAGGVNPDYFRLTTPAHELLKQPFVSVDALDARVDVHLFDAGRSEIASWLGTQSVRFRPHDDSTNYLLVSGTTQTRYRLALGLELDRDQIPGPFQEYDLDPVPSWWDGPWQGRIRNPEQYFSVHVDPRKRAGRGLVFEASAASARLTLHDIEGNVVGEAVRDGNVHRFETERLDAAAYIVKAVVDEAEVGSVMRTFRPAW